MDDKYLPRNITNHEAWVIDGDIYNDRDKALSYLLDIGFSLNESETYLDGLFKKSEASQESL